MTTPPSEGPTGANGTGDQSFQPMTPEQWREGFTSANGREPTMSEYQNAVSAGWIRQEGQRGQAAEQFSAGAKKFAAGTKDLWNNRVVPAATSAADSVRTQVAEQSGGRGSKLPLWGAFALMALGLLGIIASFMPAVDSYIVSVGYYSSQMDHLGVVVLLAGLAVIGLAAALVITRALWARIAAGVMGLIAALLFMIFGFGVTATVSDAVSSSEYGYVADFAGVQSGSGAVLLGVVGVLLIPASVLAFFPTVRKAPAGNAFAPQQGQNGAPQQSWSQQSWQQGQYTGQQAGKQPQAPAAQQPGAGQPGAQQQAAPPQQSQWQQGHGRTQAPAGGDAPAAPHQQAPYQQTSFQQDQAPAADDATREHGQDGTPGRSA